MSSRETVAALARGDYTHAGCLAMAVTMAGMLCTTIG